MSSPLNRRYVRTLIFYAALYALAPVAAAVGVLAGCRGPFEIMGHWLVLLLVVGGATLAAFAFGFAVIRRALGPGREFLERVETLLKGLPGGHTAVRKGAPAVFDHIGTLLTRMEDHQWFPHLIGSSQRMRAVLHQVRVLAPAGLDALVCGEDGTGKTLLAETIHRYGPRSEAPLERIDCRLRPTDKLVRKLWGEPNNYLADSDAGADGALTRAQGGTLLPEAVDALPRTLQARLAEAVEATGPESRQGTVRLVGTTGVDLGQEAAANQFHAGLYARLEGFRIKLPPLRDRLDDLPALATRFSAGSREDRVIEAAALQALIGYDWPGNVKELKSVVETAVTRSGSGSILMAHLPAAIQTAGGFAGPAAGSTTPPANIDALLQAMEKEMIAAALKQTAGIQVRAAELLGINQRSLWHRIKKYGIDAAAFKKA